MGQLQILLEKILYFLYKIRKYHLLKREKNEI